MRTSSVVGQRTLRMVLIKWLLVNLGVIGCCGYETAYNPGYYHSDIVLPRDVMVHVINTIGIKLLLIHNENNENNIAISPYGALSVLVALGEGLRGNAVNEIQFAARIPADISVIRVGLRDIHRHLKSYFIPKEGFLAGLTLNHDNVTLNREYEDILRFYGYDVESFNNALYPDPYTTEKPDISTETTTLPTEELIGNDGTSTTFPTTILTSTMNGETRTTRSEPTTTSAEEASTTIMTTQTPVTVEVMGKTTPVITTQPSTTIEGTTTMKSIEQPSTTMLNQETTTMQLSTTNDAATTILFTSASETTTASEIMTTDITVIPLTTPSTVTTEMTTISTNIPSTTPPPTTTETTSLSTTTVPPTTETTTISIQETTVVPTNPSTIVSPLPLLNSDQTSPSDDYYADYQENTSVNENVMETTENFLITDNATPSTPVVTDLTTDENSVLPLQTTSIVDTVTTETPNYDEVNSAENVITNKRKRGTEISSIITLNNFKNYTRRNTRSVVDYIIARYYDDHYISPRPPSYIPEEQLTFLVNGKYREPNINFMKYDTVLPFFYIPHLDAMALSFPLDSTKYYLLLLLPVKDDGVDQLICDLKLTEGKLRYIIENLRYTHVVATIPSFMLKGYVNLTPTFQKLGIKKVFEPRHADFSPMTTQKEIYVTNIEQAVTVTIRNYVDPDILKNNHRNLYQYESVQFKADHPFLYFVIDSEIHVTLMAGKIVNPLNSRIR